MSLPRRAITGNACDRIEMNVFDVTTKEIIFTGTLSEIGNRLGVNTQRVSDALRRKYRLLRKYAIRYKKDSQ